MTLRPVLFFLLAGVLSCQAPKADIPSGTVVKLYESAAPGSEAWTYPEGKLVGADGQRTLYNITEPTLEYFAPDNPTGVAVLVVPGGGFQILSYDGEGTLVAKELNSRGVAAFVLKYRTRPMLDDTGMALDGLGAVLGSFTAEAERTKSLFEHENPGKTPGMYDLASRVENMSFAYDDASAAMKYIDGHAKEYGIRKVGMVGFSAGAIITLHQAQFHSKETRPDFVGVIYGGWDERFSVPEDAMPMFLCSPVNDVFLPEENLRVFKAWRNEGVPIENHFYYDCQHGFGANRTGKSSDNWLSSMFAFLKDVNLIKQ